MFDDDIRLLKSELAQNGFFNSDQNFFWNDITLNIIFKIISLYLLNISITLSVFFLGIFYMRIGWLSHDLQHGQFLKKPSRLLYWFTGWIQGLNYSWWMHKHNRHHLAPNAYTYKQNNLIFIDEDMDTTPLLTWNIKFTNFQKNLILIQWQHLFYLPSLLFLRILWIINSISYALKSKKYLNLISLIIYFIIFYVISFKITGSNSKTLAYLILGNLLGGIFIGLTVVVNHFGHNPHEFNKNKKYEDIVKATTDIKDNFFINFFMGGMQYHTAHHLYPKVPRRKLRIVTVKIVELCNKHKIQLNLTTWPSAFNESYKQLIKVRNEYRKSIK